MENAEKCSIARAIYGGAFAIALPIMIELGPPLIRWAMQVYDNATRDPETPEEKRAHYARISASLEEANVLVQNTPLPPPGSGR